MIIGVIPRRLGRTVIRLISELFHYTSQEWRLLLEQGTNWTLKRTEESAESQNFQFTLMEGSATGALKVNYG